MPKFPMRERPAQILHIEASPRGSRSRSAKVARRLIDRLGNVTVENLNLFDADLPPFEGATLEGRYALIAGEELAPQVSADWAAIEARIDHFLSFDGWVFSVPMWNFGVPYRLKHYIDLLTQPGRAFSVDPEKGVIGHATGRTAILIGSGALDIRPDSPMAALDHQIAFLQTWLNFIGVTDMHMIHIRPTYGPDAVVESAMTQAYAEADQLASTVSFGGASQAIA